MFIDIQCCQLKKHGQNALGDHFASKRDSEAGRVIAVLSDGLGSGIKANILACMTATMLLRFLDEDVNIGKAAEIIMNSLPVCKIRKISYATFSAIECDEDGNVRIVEEGSPEFVWLRGNEEMKAYHRLVASKSFPERQMKVYEFQVQLGDRIIFCSDGVTQAGLGSMGQYRLGLRRSGLVELLQAKVKLESNVSSSVLSQYIVEQARLVHAEGQPKDDISLCAIYFRTPRRSLVFTGPPFEQGKDALYARMFAKFEGKKAVCGGTTSKIISRELGLSLTVDDQARQGGLPPAFRMRGVDLITDGVLTMSRALDYLEKNELEHDDPAGKLVRFLLNSDMVHFMVGLKLNQAHHDPRQPMEFDIRRNIVDKIAAVLGGKYLKKVTIQRI